MTPMNMNTETLHQYLDMARIVLNTAKQAGDQKLLKRTRSTIDELLDELNRRSTQAEEVGAEYFDELVKLEVSE